MSEIFITRDGRRFPQHVVEGQTIVSPYDLRAYADAEHSDLSVGTRSLLRWVARQWEDASTVDWDEVK